FLLALANFTMVDDEIVLVGDAIDFEDTESKVRDLHRAPHILRHAEWAAKPPMLAIWVLYLRSPKATRCQSIHGPNWLLIPVVRKYIQSGPGMTAIRRGPAIVLGTIGARYHRTSDDQHRLRSRERCSTVRQGRPPISRAAGRRESVLAQAVGAVPRT